MKNEKSYKENKSWDFDFNKLKKAAEDILDYEKKIGIHSDGKYEYEHREYREKVCNF